MTALKTLWEKFKGILAMTALTAIVGIGGLIATVGLEVVDGPENAVCIQAIVTEVAE